MSSDPSACAHIEQVIRTFGVFGVVTGQRLSRYAGGALGKAKKKKKSGGSTAVQSSRGVSQYRTVNQHAALCLHRGASRLIAPPLHFALRWTNSPCLTALRCPLSSTVQSTAAAHTDTKKNMMQANKSASIYACTCAAGAGPQAAGGLAASQQSAASGVPSQPPSAPPCRLLALDAEMVGASPDGVGSLLARVSLVDCAGRVVIDRFVQQPPNTVSDYRTQFSGIRPHMLEAANGALPFEVVQRELRSFLDGSRIIVGHGLEHDFRVIKIIPPFRFMRDTARCRLLCPNPLRPRKLKDLTREKLGIEIQRSGAGHDSAEDARAAMQIYLSVAAAWEASLLAAAKVVGAADAAERQWLSECNEQQQFIRGASARAAAAGHYDDCDYDDDRLEEYDDDLHYDDDHYDDYDDEVY